jgi:hypothetical protein
LVPVRVFSDVRSLDISPRRQLNVRLPPDLIKQIETDKRSKQDAVEAAVRAYFDDSMMIAALTGQSTRRISR